MAKYDRASWRRILASSKTTLLTGWLRRMVENQEQKVTVALVNDLAEHEVLENLLEDSKPGFGMSPGLLRDLARLDYLLRTPWRYPPLRWGSRFGRRFEPSLFYGALSDPALYAEAAYYRLVFLAGMERPFRDRVISQFTVFSASYQATAGMDLTQPPFDRHEAVLRDRQSYLPCQELGSELRERGVEALVYWSARTLGREKNIALFTPAALRSRKHRNPRHGICETRAAGVSFRIGESLFDFPREDFLVDGRLPVPA